MLCLSLSAQNEKRGPDHIFQQSITKNDFADSFNSFRGATSDVILTLKTSPYSVRKGTVAEPFGSQIGTSGGAVQCLEYIDGVLYGVRYASSANQFGTINQTTGAFSVTKANFHTQGADAASMAYNPVDGKTYVFPWTSNDSQGSRFGTVNLANGDFTTIATWPTDGTKTYYAAIDEDGTCYAIRNLSNQFGTIDLATGNFTQKATLSGVVDVYYIQDLSFDRETGELYWVGTTNYNSTTQVTTNNHYWKINKETGALTDLGANTLMPQGFSILNWYPSPCPAVTNVTATIFEKNKVEVKWKAPEVITNLIHYKIYQNDEEKATVHKDTTEWISAVLADGTYTFEVVAMYSNGCIPEKVAATPIEIKTCDYKVTGLAVEFETDCSKATITWDGSVLVQYNVYRDSVKIAGPIAEKVFEDSIFDPTLPHIWSVAAFCLNGLEGEWVSVEKEVCEVPPCDPILSLSIEYVIGWPDDCSQIILTWEAPEGATKFNIYRDGKLIEEEYEDTTFNYTDLEELLPHIWGITVVCEKEESEVVSEPLGVCESVKNHASTFSIIPNPATNKITISAINNLNTIEILGYLGQVVFLQTNAENTTTLDISNLTNGIYFVRIVSENGTSVKKFVKK